MGKMMLAVALLATFVGGGPAFAVECDPNQGKEFMLDFQHGTAGEPLLELDLRVVGESCVDGATIYHLKYLDGNFESKQQVIETFKMVQTLRRRFAPESILTLLRFVEQTEKQASTQ